MMEEIDPLDAFMQSLEDTDGSCKIESKSTFKRGIDQLDEEYDIADFCEYMNTKEYLDKLEQNTETTNDITPRKLFPPLLSIESSETPFNNFNYTHTSDIELMDLDQLVKVKEKLGIFTTGSRVPKPITKFDHISHCLSAKVMDNIKKMGVTTPTPVQCQAIPSIFMKRDTIIFCEMGHGRDLSFIIPIVTFLAEYLKHNKTDNKSHPHCLVITPTREMCIQHYKTFKKLCHGTDIITVALIGNIDKAFLNQTFSNPCHVIISNMGKLVDLVHSKVIDLSHIKLLVMDEADKLFNLINIKQAESLITGTPRNKLIVFVCTTKTDKLLNSLRNLTKSPIVISVAHKETGYPVDNVDVKFVITQTLVKKKLWLFDILPIMEDKGQVAIFCNTHSKVEELAEILNDQAIRQKNKAAIFVRGIHDQMSNDDIASIVESFKKLSFPTLVTTSLFYRNIEIAPVKVVINFDAPQHFNEYCHRISTCGREGNNGIAYTLIDPKNDMKVTLKIVEHLKMIGKHVPNNLKKLLGGKK